MLQTKNALYKVILIITLLLMIPCALASALIVVGQDTMTTLRISGTAAIVTLLLGFYYVTRGYSKEQAWAFRSFMYCFALTMLMTVVFVGGNTDSMPAIALSTVMFGLICVIASGKDLGKKKSLWICALICVLGAAALIEGLIRNPVTEIGGHGAAVAVRTVSNLLLGILLLMMTVAKYIDKAARGSK